MADIDVNLAFSDPIVVEIQTTEEILEADISIPDSIQVVSESEEIKVDAVVVLQDPLRITVATDEMGNDSVIGPSSAVNLDFAQFDGGTGKLIKDTGLNLDTDGALTANSDSKIPSQKAVKTFAGTRESPLTFNDSVSRSSNTVTLTNDSATPGNSKYYGTDGGGTRGYHDLPASGSSVLEFQITRVDSSGNDGTGIIGDIGKPYLTVQGAISDIETASPGNGSGYLIEIDNNSFSEDLTTSLQFVFLKGSGSDVSGAFNSITFSEAAAGVNLIMIGASGGSVVAGSSGGLGVQINDGSTGDVSNSSGGVNVYGENNPYVTGNITATGVITVEGLKFAGTLSSPGQNIFISNCVPLSDLSTGAYQGAAVIDSTGSEVWATASIIGSVVAAGTLHLVDSRVQGSNAATSEIYADVLLQPFLVTDSSATSGTVTATGHPQEAINLTSGSTIVSITVEIGACPNRGIIRLHSKSIVTALTVTASGGTFEDAAVTTLVAGGNAAWQNDNSVFIRIQ